MRSYAVSGGRTYCTVFSCEGWDRCGGGRGGGVAVHTTVLLHSLHQPQYDVPLQSMSAGDVKTFEEREEEYEKVRARIFSQQPISQVSVQNVLIKRLTEYQSSGKTCL